MHSFSCALHCLRLLDLDDSKFYHLSFIPVMFMKVTVRSRWCAALLSKSRRLHHLSPQNVTSFSQQHSTSHSSSYQHADLAVVSDPHISVTCFMFLFGIFFIFPHVQSQEEERKPSIRSRGLHEDIQLCYPFLTFSASHLISHRNTVFTLSSKIPKKLKTIHWILFPGLKTFRLPSRKLFRSKRWRDLSFSQ